VGQPRGSHCSLPGAPGALAGSPREGDPGAHLEAAIEDGEDDAVEEEDGIQHVAELRLHQRLWGGGGGGRGPRVSTARGRILHRSWLPRAGSRRRPSPRAGEGARCRGGAGSTGEPQSPPPLTPGCPSAPRAPRGGFEGSQLVPKGRGGREGASLTAMCPPSRSPSPPAAGVRSSSRAAASSRRAPIARPGLNRVRHSGAIAPESATAEPAPSSPPARAALALLPPSSSPGHTGEPASAAVPSSGKGQRRCCSRGRRAVPKRHPPQPYCGHRGAAGAPPAPGGGGCWGRPPGCSAGSAQSRGPSGLPAAGQGGDHGKGKLPTTSLTQDREEEQGSRGSAEEQGCGGDRGAGQPGPGLVFI